MCTFIMYVYLDNSKHHYLNTICTGLRTYDTEGVVEQSAVLTQQGPYFAIELCATAIWQNY